MRSLPQLQYTLPNKILYDSSRLFAKNEQFGTNN